MDKEESRDQIKINTDAKLIGTRIWDLFIAIRVNCWTTGFELQTVG